MPRSSTTEKEPTVQTTVYLSLETVALLEVLAQTLAPREYLNRQTVIRIAIARGLESLLETTPAKSPPAPVSPPATRRAPLQRRSPQ